ncbi:MAG: choice-of-anchor K domain-containing protein [Planctomycetota bacterium]|nr:choice-of-anchor K domain-containing protein [Planctomycetota bacterium]
MDPRNKRIWAQLCAFVGCMLVVAWLNTSAAAQTVDGSSSGVFINAVGEPNLVTTGLGTSDFSWGEAFFSGTDPSSLSFTGTAFSTDVEQQFVVGTLDYFNGATVSGTQATSVDLEITLNITSPTGTDANLVFPFSLVNRPNTLDPIESADSIFLSSQTTNRFFNLDGRFFTLAIGFANATQGGFENVDEFFVFENESASAELIGIITPNVTPEPSTFVLALLGLLSLGLIGRRRRRR